MTTLADLTVEENIDMACASHTGVWSEVRRGFTNQPFHWEWYDLMHRYPRLCVVAPREFAKSEVFTVNQVAWRCCYYPGYWSYVFTQTGDQGHDLLERIDDAIEQAEPALVENMLVENRYEHVYANGARVNAAGAGKRVRGAHPDLIIGDDVLDDESTATSAARAAMSRWWFGTIGGMAHPGTERMVGGTPIGFDPTRVNLVGTPFHESDLLMAMKGHPIYRYYRYAAEYDPALLVGCAVEVA